MKLSPNLEAEILRRAGAEGTVGPACKVPGGTGQSLTPAFVRAWQFFVGRDIAKSGAVLEFRFDEKRRWRFDVAWPDRKLAVELHGGTWQQGRHQRGAGFTRDREKMRAAIAQGWRVLEFTDQDLRERPAQVVEQVRGVLGEAEANAKTQGRQGARKKPGTA